MSLRPVNVHKFLEKKKRRAGNWGTQVNARKFALKIAFVRALKIFTNVNVHRDTRQWKSTLLTRGTLKMAAIRHWYRKTFNTFSDWIRSPLYAINSVSIGCLFYFLPFLVRFLLFPKRKLVFQLDPIRLGSYEPWFPLLHHQLFHGTVFPGRTGTKCKYDLNDMLWKLTLPSKESPTSKFDIFFNV